MKSSRIFIKSAFILLLLNFSGRIYAQVQQTYNGCLSEFNNFPKGAVYNNNQLSPAERVKDVIKHLTFEEAFSLLGGVNNMSLPGVPRLGLRPVQMADASQGIHLRKGFKENENSTSFPGTLALASTWNPDLATEMGKSIGLECRGYGVDILLGPGIDFHRFSVSGRNYEYMGEDPELTSRMAVNYIKGVQSKQVLATGKHFIGNDQEFCRHFASSDISERTLREIYLRPWKAVIQEAGVKAIMTGNNAINGVPCALDKQLVNDVIRDEYGFSGMAMTDWQNSMYFPKLQYMFPASGVSLLMPDNKAYAKYQEGYLAQYPGKKEKMRQEIDKKVFMNLLPLFEMGVYDRVQENKEMLAMMGQNKVVARKIAEEAICLLKNEDQLLPLSDNKKILLMGKPEIYSGKGSGFVKGYDHVSFADGLMKVYGKKLVESENPTEDQIKSADVIIYRLNKEAGEGEDVPFEVGLDLNIANVAGLNPNVIVVINSCNGLPMPWIPNVKAVLWCYFLGQERGNALAEVICGKVNPSGKLPFTLEKDFKDSQDPDFNFLGNNPYWLGNNNSYKQYWLGIKPDGANEQFRNFVQPHEMIRVPYVENVFIGYRWYDKGNKEVHFPFGFGLSYTEFNYGNMILSGSKMNSKESLAVSLMVTNSGKKEGAEVVQLYISDKECSIDRPVKELKYFKKVYLKPGESKEVQFTVKPNDLAFWNEKKHGWQVEPGTFEVNLGSSSRDIRLQQSFEFME